ncbi:unnamed protein product [Lota lota]
MHANTDRRALGWIKMNPSPSGHQGVKEDRFRHPPENMICPRRALRNVKVDICAVPALPVCHCGRARRTTASGQWHAHRCGALAEELRGVLARVVFGGSRSSLKEAIKRQKEVGGHVEKAVESV